MCDNARGFSLMFQIVGVLVVFFVVVGGLLGYFK